MLAFVRLADSFLAIFKGVLSAVDGAPAGLLGWLPKSGLRFGGSALKANDLDATSCLSLSNLGIDLILCIASFMAGTSGSFVSFLSKKAKVTNNSDRF